MVNGPVEFDVPVNEESLTMKVERDQERETCRWYFVAPAELPQLNVNVVGCAVALLAGELRAGADGIESVCP